MHFFFTDFDVHVDTSPFKHCIVENFIQDTEYLRELKEELLDLKFVRKRNDLYQFHQSHDLSEINKPLINSLKQFLVEECCAWLEMATSIKLNSKVSVTCSSYNYLGKYIILELCSVDFKVICSKVSHLHSVELWYYLIEDSEHEADHFISSLCHAQEYVDSSFHTYCKQSVMVWFHSLFNYAVSVSQIM
jgi:hypothetical protein